MGEKMKFINALHEEYVPTSWLTFDDVLLVPRYSTLKSRNDSKISTKSALFSYDSINIPIISANMDTVTGSEMAIAMNNLGGLGILHRFHKKFDDYKKEIYKVFDECQQVSFSVGIGNDWLDFAKSIKKELENKTNSYHQVSVCLDVAHGHMEQSVEMVKMLHDELDPFFIIAGNIATPSGA
jgi:IMP dehydrogenase